ncbi:hypothetical protein NC651_026697 [Populus alba x Populus x berolinensis]|nr:hypothetical protein NC651_026697 [Populus alba x Populus x berolinensis]
MCCGTRLRHVHLHMRLLVYLMNLQD